MRNKSIHLLLTAFFLLLSNYVSAYSFSAENEDGVTIYYTIITSASKTAEVTYKDINYNSYSGDVKIPETVQNGDNVYSVISIGNYAFKSCSSLVSVEIPNSVTSIWNYAFQDCSSLESVVIPNSVTSIGSSAFYNCSKINTIDIQDINKFLSISGLSNLTSYSSNKTLTRNGEPYNDIVISEGITSIPVKAFYNFTNITSIDIPNSVTSIGNSAFKICI